MADQITTAFSTGQMKGLDAKGLRSGQVNLTIENTAGDVEFNYYRFSSFAAIGRWLKKHEIDGMPHKVVWPLTGCKNGKCEFFLDGGILHNQLYFTKLTYIYKNKKLLVTGIQFMAG